jgi:hypothetical protein
MQELDGRLQPAEGDRLISVNGHLNQPPDTFTLRVAQALRGRAPRIDAFEQ